MTKRLDTNDKIVGIKQVRRALGLEEVETVYIAEDADLNLVQDIIDSCKKHNIPIVEVKNMEKLGELCKIDVNAAIAAVFKK